MSKIPYMLAELGLLLGAAQAQADNYTLDELNVALEAFNESLANNRFTIGIGVDPASGGVVTVTSNDVNRGTLRTIISSSFQQNSAVCTACACGATKVIDAVLEAMGYFGPGFLSDCSYVNFTPSLLTESTTFFVPGFVTTDLHFEGDVTPCGQFAIWCEMCDTDPGVIGGPCP